MKFKIVTFVLLCFLIVFFCVPAVHAESAKDHMKAFFLSFAVPGLGEYYAGSPGSARMFIAAELAIWGGYYYNVLLKENSRDDYLQYASLHAGANPSIGGASYINAMVSFNSSFDYNQHQLQVSSNPVQYDGQYVWNWGSPQHRRHFKKLREQELDYENYTKYCVAGAILNHFLSGLHASRLVRMQQESNKSVTIHVIDSGLAALYSWSY